jgi:hypothetical protein
VAYFHGKGGVVQIVTGIGRNSEGNIAKVKPAVIK